MLSWVPIFVSGTQGYRGYNAITTCTDKESVGLESRHLALAIIEHLRCDI